MRMFTADGEYKRVCELTDAEIDAIAWREAEQASDQAINKHNASVAAMKRKSGEAQ